MALPMFSFVVRWWVAVDPIDEILEAGRRRADETEVWLATGSSVEAMLRKRKISSATGSDHQTLSIRVIKGGRIGVSSTDDPSSWKACLDAALQSAALAAPQEWGGLPSSSGVAGRFINFDESVVPDPEKVRDLISGMEVGAYRHPVEITSGSAQISQYRTVLANTHGLYCEDRESLVSVGLETSGTVHRLRVRDIVEDGHRPGCCRGESGVPGSHVTRGKGHHDGDLRCRSLPDALGQLMGTTFLPALSGRNVHAGRSRLAPFLGQEVCDTALSLVDEPLHPRGLGSCLWDGEGTPTRVLKLVEKGVLRCFAYDLKTAYQFGKETTGNAVRSGLGGGVGIGFHCMTLDGPRREICEEETLWAQTSSEPTLQTHSRVTFPSS